MSEEALKAHNQSAKQPLVIWVIFFATIISFMGLGLVDPILPAIAEKLHATPSQVSLLFTSYNLITGIAMLITGVVSSRIGIKWTLLIGILFIIIFSALAGSSNGIWGVVGLPWWLGSWKCIIYCYGPICYCWIISRWNGKSNYPL